MGKFSGAIRILIIACVAVFAVTFLVPGMKDEMFQYLALYYPQHENFRLWQFVTNMFMHGNLAHILFNMYALWAFGSPLEQMWGRNKFLIFYFTSGIGAGLVYLGVNFFRFNALYDEFIASGITEKDIAALLETGKYNLAAMNGLTGEQLETFYRLFNTPAVGASGAIYGILVAFGMLFPNAKLFLIFLPFPIAAKYFIPILIGLDLFSGLTGFSIFGGGIAHFAHVGGAVIGFLLMWYWSSKKVKENLS